MPRKTSLEPKTRIIKVPRKNGDIYVYERITKYNPQKHYTEVLKSRLIGKILPGEDAIVPTSSSRKSPGTPPEASTRRVGATDILEWIGRASGVDADLLRVTDADTAKKIISIARYQVANPGRTLPHFVKWQSDHRIPYADGMSEDTCYALMRRVGGDEDLIQKFFRARAARMPSGASIAFDSTTVSSYSRNQKEARFGCNKAGDGLKTVKFLTLYCVDDRQPVAYSKQPGDIPDVVSVSNACSQLLVLGLKNALMVMDAGFCSEHNMCTLIRRHFKFLMRGLITVKWIRAELDARMDSVRCLENVCPFETTTYGFRVTVMHRFHWTRERSRSGVSRGDTVSEEHRVYLYFYLNTTKADTEVSELADDVLDVAKKLESGVELTKPEEELAEKYLITRKTRSGLSVSFNEEAFRDATHYAGWFVLISNSPEETFDALRTYRMREKIEEFYRCDKQNADAKRTRVWSTDSLNGRFFIQFVTLCYYEYLHREISKLKETLAVPNGDPTHDTKKNLENERKLRKWLRHMSIGGLFEWFDCIEETTVDNGMNRRRWRTETTARDRMFLEKLGVIKA